MQWIPVSERLPKHGELCLITVEVEGKRFTANNTAYFHEKQTFGFNWWFEEYVNACCAEVVAWMPLPEPYEVE